MLEDIRRGMFGEDAEMCLSNKRVDVALFGLMFYFCWIEITNIYDWTENNSHLSRDNDYVYTTIFIKHYIFTKFD